MFFGLYISMFSVTAIPGNKMFTGMVFGLGEGSSMIFSTYLCTIMNDRSAFSLSCCIYLVSQSVFFFICEGKSDGLLALGMIFLSVVGCGSNVNTVYLMMGQRFAPEKLGSAIVVVITCSVIYSMFAS